MKTRFLLFALLALLGLNALSAQEIFRATLSGQQEAYAIATPATGEVVAELSGNQLTVTGAFDNLRGMFDATVAGGAHLHIAPAGSNGAVAYRLTTVPATDLRGGAFAALSNTFTLSAEEVAQLRAGLFYVNIHTTIYGGGELRGQLLPEADTYFWANLFGSNEVPAIMTEAAGAVAAYLNGDSLVVSGSFYDLSGELATDIAGGAHLHLGFAGDNGPVAYPLVVELNANGTSGTFLAAENAFELSAAQRLALFNGEIYVNIHSQAYRSGELRGQLLPRARAAFRAHVAAANSIPLQVSTASGQVVATMTDTTLVLTGTVRGLESELALDIAGGAHIHLGTAGSTGELLIPLALDPDMDNRGFILQASRNTYQLNAELEAALLERQLYLNVHTLDKPGGEVRGQMLGECQYVLTAPLNSVQEIPDANSTAYGMLKAEVSGFHIVTSGSFSGLSSNLNIDILGGAHLHAGLPGQTGGVAFPLQRELDVAATRGVFPASRNRFELEADQLALLQARGMYVNIHSLNFGPGEIRGNLLAEAQNYFFAPLSGAAQSTPVRTGARGMAVIEARADSMTLVGSYADLSSALATDIAGGAHIHGGYAGGNGPVLVPLQVMTNGNAGVFAAAENTYNLSSGALDSLRNDLFYVNVHSLDNPMGEIRGQLLANAETFFHTSLSGINETTPFVGSGTGGLKLRLVDSTLICSGSFAMLAGEFDANIAGGAHLHLGTTGTDGAPDLFLTPNLAADNRSGVFAPTANTFTLNADQIASLRAGDYYANIHTTAQASGEIRGQVLPEVNMFPMATSLLTPIAGAEIDIVGDALTEFTTTWQPASDPDGHTLAYVWQLAADANFENVLFATMTGNELFFTTDFGTVDALLASAGVAVDGEVTLYHRVVVTDGSNATPGAGREVVLQRGTVTNTDDVFAQQTTWRTYPTQTTGIVSVEIESAENRAAELWVVNQLGQPLQRTTTQLTTGELRLQVDLSSYPAGQYYLLLRSEGAQLSVQKIVKQ